MVRLPLSVAKLASSADIERLVVTVVKQLVVPALTAAWLDADVLAQPVAAGLTLGDVLAAAKVIAKAGPGATATWALANAKALVEREALQLVADIAALLAERAQAGVTIDELGAQLAAKVTSPTAGTTSLGVELTARPPTLPPPAGAPPSTIALPAPDGVAAGLEAIALTGLEIVGGKPRFAPALEVRGLYLDVGSKTAPILPTGVVTLESARLSADLALGGSAGLAITKVGVDVPGAAPRPRRRRWRPGLEPVRQGRQGQPRLRTRLRPHADRRRHPPEGTAAPVGQPRRPARPADPAALRPRRSARPSRWAASPRSITSTLLLDGGFALGLIAVSASGLGVSFQPRHLASPADWRFTLDGLGLALDAGPVSLAGFLQRTGAQTPRGAALVKFAGFQIGAGSGAYSRIADQPSLFVFGALNAPLGGPPFFFVTGVAGGFGANRGLVIPDDPDASLPRLLQGHGGRPEWLADVGKMGELVLAAKLPAEQGASWFAAGVKFTSFSLIRGQAILHLRFGKKLASASPPRPGSRCRRSPRSPWSSRARSPAARSPSAPTW